MTPDPSPAVRVRQHTALQSRGGAARVARLLHEFLPGQGVESSLSFETAEEPGAVEIPAGRAGQNLEPGTILHLHSTLDWPGLLAALPAVPRRDRPLVLTLHDAGLLTGGCPYPLECPGAVEGCAEPCPRGFPEVARRRAFQLERLRALRPVLVAPSGWMARLVRAALPGASPRLVPNDVPWPAARPSQAAARKALGIAPKARVLVFAAHGGTAAAYKSGPRWLEYWRGIKARVPAALGFAVGGAGSRREGDLVVWPYVDRERLGLLLAAADLLFHPTLADNHPLVVLEAMSQGTACAAFAVGGLPEQIQDGENGVLAPAGDEQGLMERAADLLNHPARARALGENAFTRGRTAFSAERLAADMARLYRGLAA